MQFLLSEGVTDCADVGSVWLQGVSLLLTLQLKYLLLALDFVICFPHKMPLIAQDNLFFLVVAHFLNSTCGEPIKFQTIFLSSVVFCCSALSQPLYCCFFLTSAFCGTVYVSALIGWSSFNITTSGKKFLQI